MRNPTPPREQNQPGLTRQHERFRSRGRSLLETETFLVELRERRQQWIARFDAYRFPLNLAAPETLCPSDLPSGIVLPPALAFAASEYRVVLDEGGDRDGKHAWIADFENAFEEYFAMVQGLSEKGWSRRFHPHRNGPHHPGIPLVSAAVVYDHRTVISLVDQLVPSFRLVPRSLPSRPRADAPSRIAALEAENAALRRAILEPDAQRRAALAREARLEGFAAGTAVARAAMTADPRDQFHYIEVVEGMAGRDLKSNAEVIAEYARDVFGANGCDRALDELVSDGTTHVQAAAIVGVDVKSVPKALRRIRSMRLEDAA